MSVLTGLGMLQLAALIPRLGIPVTIVGFWGAGAVVLMAWRSFRWARGTTAPPAAA